MSESKSTTSTHLTPAQKAKAIELWKSGRFTLEDLSKMYGKAPRTFMRLFKKEGIEKGSSAEEIAEKVKEEVKKTAVGEVMETVDKIRATKEEHYKVNQVLFKMHWNEITRLVSERLPMAAGAANFKAIQLALQNFRVIREERYTLLGITEENDISDELPELSIHELTQDQIDEMRAAVASRDDDEMSEDELDMEIGEIEVEPPKGT